MKNFLNKPWTWGTYLKLTGVSMLLSMIYVVFFWWKYLKIK